jgi:hypothetical protein
MTKKPVWNPTCKRFVAFLDIMGFKDMVLREKHREIKNTLISFYPAIKIIKEMAEKRMVNTSFFPIRRYNNSTTRSVVFPVIFSDSILLVTNDNSERSAHKLLLYTSVILQRATINKIPLKGAIAYGEFTAVLGKSLYFGKPLIDAYELQNELQLYGVIMHHTMEKQMTNFIDNNLKVNDMVVRWPVPMKSGKINHLILDWIPSDENAYKNWVTELYNTVSGKPRIHVDNTLEFIRWVTEKKAELNQNETKDKLV